MKSSKVYYVAGKGWHYKLHGDVRGPFATAEQAGIEMESERYQLRAIRRAEAGEAMTFADEQRELAAMGYRGWKTTRPKPSSSTPRTEPR